MEVADLKHALHGTEVEVKLLEERMEGAEGSIDSARESTDLNRKIVVLEKNLDKLASELRALTHFSTQTTAALSSYRQQIGAIDSKLDEIAKLRSTLTELSRSASPIETASYQVKSGDSLEKIARKYQISVDALKRENNLSSDKIVVGQQLAIPTK
ncbi:MAG: LysM peptidoglycan-binding domain-containing protein [Rhabdochlamydiaceae bacterium]|nr:LysM peptidoglycan-binding domain-containing protein [Rhabdochlamydiaceae bacterium]